MTAGSFLLAYFVGSSFWGIMTGAWLGLIIIFLQALYTWSLVFNPMKGVDQTSYKQDKPRNDN
ncbi:MAG: hypothetical protein M3Q07_03130 [Pseudobdellovibrionaceae bacterium]|nr:hypothetical protein [Pseudobdellovibrionaceae bacterium]